MESQAAGPAGLRTRDYPDATTGSLNRPLLSGGSRDSVLLKAPQVPQVLLYATRSVTLASSLTIVCVSGCAVAQADKYGMGGILVQPCFT